MSVDLPTQMRKVAVVYDFENSMDKMEANWNLETNMKIQRVTEKTLGLYCKSQKEEGKFEM